MGGGAGWEIFYFKIISRDCLFCFLFFLRKKEEKKSYSIVAVRLLRLFGAKQGRIEWNHSPKNYIY